MTGRTDPRRAADRRRAAVLGHPVAHSLSPVLHRAAYAALDLDGWTYDRLDVTPEALPGVLAGLDDSWGGLSLTMPLKQAVLPLLDHVEPLAATVGAANTVLTSGRGGARVLVGANTDVHGIVAAVREAADGSPVPGPALVLGAGATAASALAALAELGHPRAVVVVRSRARAEGLLAAADRLGVQPDVRTWDRAPEILADAGVVVSTVPAGAADELADELADRRDAGRTPGRPTAERLVCPVLLDVVYDPWPTPLATAWMAGGGEVAPGWSMLLHQAAEQVRLMTGRRPPVVAMREALLASLAGRSR